MIILYVHVGKFIFLSDNWLKKIEKPKKKKKMRNGEHSSQTANSMEVLLAAGLHVNSLNWSKPSRDSSSTAVKAAPIAKNSGLC